MKLPWWFRLALNLEVSYSLKVMIYSLGLNFATQVEIVGHQGSDSVTVSG